MLVLVKVMFGLQNHDDLVQVNRWLFNNLLANKP